MPRKAVIVDELISSNPVERAKRPHAQLQEPGTVWTVAQLRAFLDTAAHHRLGAFFHVAAYTGARRGELLNLRWTDIDLDAKRITVTGSTAVIAGERIDGTTKSGRTRVVSIDDGTVAVLRRHNADQAADQLKAGDAWRGVKDGYVFTTGWGDPVYPDTVTSLMTKLIHAHNQPDQGPPPKDQLPRARLHDLRHLHATTLLLSGVPVHVVAARLGHADPAITLRVYAHVIRTAGAAAAGIFAAGGRLTDQITLGVLAASVPRDAVDDAVAAAGRQARRRDGKLPPHVMVYFAMAMALFADEDYEEVAARLAGTLTSWKCWDDSWTVPTSGGISQARQRLGYEPLRELFTQVAQPVADLLTRGAFLAGWRLMAIDGFEWDAPDTPASAAEFGYAGKSPADPARPAFPKVRVVTVSECASHAVVDAEIGGVAGKGAGEQTLARGLYRRLEEDWLVIADRNFYNWQDWCTAAGSGAALLWRVKSDLRLPLLEALPDSSYISVLVSPKITGKARDKLIEAARAGQDLDPGRARPVRVIEYDVPDRDGDGQGELIALITTITRWEQAPAAELAAAYYQRWEHETGNDQLKTHLRGPGRVLRSKSPDMVRQEIYGYLLTHHAISALICQAATEADIDPDRVKFTRTVRIVRRAIAPAAFPPQPLDEARAAVIACITARRNLNPGRRNRTYPRAVKRARHNSYRVKKPEDKGTRHAGPPTIRLVNQPTAA